ncbi:MAG: hypothetical protein R3F31_10510 [Verrucomicrobiales bacterium]
MGTRETENPGRLDLRARHAQFRWTHRASHGHQCRLEPGCRNAPRHDIYEGEEVEAASEAREAARLISSAMSDTLGAAWAGHWP